MLSIRDQDNVDCAKFPFSNSTFALKYKSARLWGNALKENLNSSVLGAAFIAIGVVVMVLTMWALLAPSSDMAIPSQIVGIGTIVSVIGLAVALIKGQ